MKQKKHLRLILDFSTTIDESAIATNENQENHEYMDRQKRLLHAVLSDKERFHAYLTYEIASHLECVDWRDWYQLLLKLNDLGVSKEVLAPSIAALDQADQEFFKEVEAHGVFYENVEEMESCFKTEIEKVEFVVLDDNEGSEGL